MRNTERTGNDSMASIVLCCSHRQVSKKKICPRSQLLYILSIAAAMKNSSPTSEIELLYMITLGFTTGHVLLKHRIEN